MTDKIDGYLKGTVARDALTPTERAQADAAGRAIEQTRAFVSGRPAPDLAAGVLRRIEQLGLRPLEPLPEPALRRLAWSLWAPRQVSFQLRPAYGLLAAAAIAVLALLPYASLQSPAGPAPAGAAEPQIFVQFRLQSPEASDVRLAGSFTNWQPQHELHETAPGIWTITLPLARGVHDYVFVVDEQHWVPDPYAPHVDDGFGGFNSRIAVLPTERPWS